MPTIEDIFDYVFHLRKDIVEKTNLINNLAEQIETLNKEKLKKTE